VSGQPRPLVAIVDDDEAVRDSLEILLTAAGYVPELYASARAFLERSGANHVGCLLADVRMPDMDGLELQEELSKRGSKLPVIIMTGHGDVPLAVRAMKAGAVDFLEKPFSRAQLVAGLEKAFQRLEADSETSAQSEYARARMTELTDRERDVLDLLIAGHQNKMIGSKLGISARTVQVHRGRIMHKLKVASLQDLVRVVMAAKTK
jgi:two-component system, LuxR family, response regulator FixJ